MIETIWTYRVRRECRAEFERRYAADGDWAKLFRQAEGYRGTVLMRDLREADRYATIDRWESRAAMEAFKKDFAREYEAVDRVCGELTMEEEHVGVFETSGDQAIW